jgi:hypothetical protein
MFSEEFRQACAQARRPVEKCARVVKRFRYS